MRFLPLADSVTVPERRAVSAAVSLLLVGVAFAAAHSIGGLGGSALDAPVRDLLSPLVYVLATAVVALRAVRVAENRAAWIALAGGLTAYMLGNLIWVGFYEGQPDAPIPSICDALWLSYYPAAYVGIAWLAWARGRRIPAGVLLDGLVAGLGVAAIVAAIVVGPVVAAAEGSAIAVATNLSYPAADVVLAALVMGVIVLRGGRLELAWTMVAGGFAVLCVADLIYLRQVASGDASSSLVANVFYFAGVTLIAIAAWHRREAASVPLNSWAMLAIPGASTIAALALLVSDHFDRLHPVALVLAGLTVLAAIVRTGVTFRDMRELDRLKDELVSSVSHEFRTPLTSIRGHTGLILSDPCERLSEQHMRSLGVIERNSGRLLRLVQDLLLAAEMQSGRFAIVIGPLDLGDLAADCVESARPTAERKDVRLRLDAEPGCRIAGDHGRIAEVLDNLIDNAIKFSHAGHTVAVVLRRDGDRCLLEVADTGIGIPAAERDRLFERFSRTTPATERHLPGTGLGLYLTRRLVEAHGGTIAFDSVEGAGTTMRVELPCAEPAVDVEIELEAAA